MRARGKQRSDPGPREARLVARGPGWPRLRLGFRDDGCTQEVKEACLRPFGMIVNYGNASGRVPPLDILDLSRKGALSVSRPGLHHHLKDIDEFRAATNELFALVADGTIRIEIGRTCPLREAAHAHRDVESRKLAGSAVLIP